MSSYPARRSTRLKDYDYAQAGAYFVTVCVEQRLPLLGRVENGEVALSAAGEMVATIWQNLDKYYPGVSTDAFVVMPTHVHGIVLLAGADEGKRGLSLSDVMQRFKSFTMHEYGVGVRQREWPRYRGRLWQHHFHDRIIRNERELNAIRLYIANNPQQWHLDRENPDLFVDADPKRSIQIHKR